MNALKNALRGLIAALTVVGIFQASNIVWHSNLDIPTRLLVLGALLNFEIEVLCGF